ncbi:Far upstream element-binding protein 3 [Goodea atripinnis]|uniref:Far upstream element-binding protein 3 n=1 Tax=Goodea atripinnis TaxID=208336 RepID=A0ABV0NNW7_9TELE
MVMGQPERCQHAVHLINELIQTAQERDGFGSALRSTRVRGRSDWTMGSPGPLQEVTYTIPADKCGLVIGKGRRRSPPQLDHLRSLISRPQDQNLFVFIPEVQRNNFR